MSHLRYCISNWCFGNETLIAKLQHLSDKFVRIIFNLSHKEDVSNVMKANNLLTIKNLYKTEISMLMFKYHKQLLPSAFDNLFTLKTFRMKTRSNSQIISNYCRFTVVQQSLTFMGPKIWNDIPYGIRDSKTSKIFKQKLFQFFMNFPL